MWPGISNLLNAGMEYSRLASGALGMAYVADGRFEGYWEKHINSWDVLAGMVLFARPVDGPMIFGERRFDQRKRDFGGNSGIG